MRSWIGEVRVILRGLGRSRVFTLQAVLTVVLGTVGVGAVYPVLHRVVLRALPYDEPSRLVTVRTSLDRQRLGVTVPELSVLSRQTDLFEGVAAVLPPQYDQSLSWTDGSRRERLRGVRATPGLIDVLGVDVSGPGFDASPAAGDEVLLGHGFWRSRFGGDPSVVGRTVSLNGRPHAVVGVLPETFEFPLSSERYDVWVVFRPDPSMPASNDNRVFRAVARLRDDASLEAATARIPNLLTDFHRRESTGIEIRRVTVRSLHEDLVGSVRTPLFLLTGAAILVLVIAALNLALLVAARNLARQRELAVRRAIGAGRGRISRLLLTEVGLIVLIGTGVGAIVATLVLDWVASGGDLDIVRGSFVSDGAGIRSTAPPLLAVLGVAWLAAVVPAVRASRSGMLASRSPGASRGAQQAMRWVVGAESALVFGLLVAAGLTLWSLEALSRVDPGFDPRGAVAVEIQLPDGEYEENEPARFFQTAEERLAGLPSVRSAGSVTHLPLDRNNWGGSLAIEGRSDLRADALPGVDWEFASPGYFEAAGIAILEGRAFTPADTHEVPRVAIINETLARRFWPDGGAIGARVNGNGFDGTWFTVVGVVGDVKQQGLEVESRGYMYMSSLQTAFWTERQLVVRTDLPEPLAVVPDVRRALLELEPDITIGSVTALGDLVRQASGAFRLRATLLGFFGLIAALLGMAGIYGVVSHGVQARRHEMGIRLAVGADTAAIFRMVIIDGLRPVVVGIVGGVALVWAAGWWLGALVYGIDPGNPWLLGAIAGTLVVSALAAVAPPALRARRADPMRVLQSD